MLESRLLSSRFRWAAALAVLAVAGCCIPAPAQEGEEDEPYLPGLVATYQDSQGKRAVRVDHQLAFHWGEAPPDPRLGDGECCATWQGHLQVAPRGEYRFFLFGTGEVELKVAGRAVVPRQRLSDGWCESAAVPLPAGFHPFEMSLKSNGKDARLMVLWSGRDFGPEPLPPRLLFHARERTPGRDFERGWLLTRALRCAACHRDEPALQPAPALDRLAGNLSRDWLVRWLAAGEHAPSKQDLTLSPRRMPAFGLSRTQAEAIADWLLGHRPPDRADPPAPQESRPPKGSKKPAPAKSQPDANSGERLFVTLGCLACHSWRDLGASGWLGGPDLTAVADKRPPGFFATWLADPARLNRDHRMPVFALSDEERTSLALFLAAQKSKEPGHKSPAPDAASRRDEGRKLVEQLRCGACHRLPGVTADKPAPPPVRLGGGSDWGQSCLGPPDPCKHRPGYHLSESDARAVRLYHAGRHPASAGKPPGRPDGRLLLVEHNCLACHPREGAREGVPLLPPLLADKLAAVARRYPALAAQVPALTPLPLNSAGDKLTDRALADAVARRGDAHRPYLQVRMPRFPLGDEEVQAIVQHLVSTDRVPERGAGAAPADRPLLDRYTLAGGRLLSSDGFGCTSCHQVGGVLPPEAPLNARGPNLSLLERRIRRPWFDRWVRNPARIVPQMEMPSVQIPVPGVLGDRLEDQLAAVWHVLNLPGFEPPPPNPVRTLRHSGSNPAAEPVVMTDVLQHGGKSLIKPFLVGLANRHNVLLDLETARLAQWTVGDTARQRTKGKTWFWELGGTTLLDTGITGPDLRLVAGGGDAAGQPLGQFVTEADAWQSEGPALVLHYRLRFSLPGPDGAATQAVTVPVRRRLAPSQDRAATGFTQELSVERLPTGARVRLELLSARAAGRAARSADGRTIHLGDRFASRIVLREPATATFANDGTSVLLAPDEKGSVHVVLHYESEVPIDRLPEVPSTPVVPGKGERVEVAPGFAGERLPLPPDIMPTGLAWRPDGRLVFCSLKGQLFEAVDADGDGSEARLVLLADGVPAPYGVHAGKDHVDVSAKYALLRVWNTGPSGRRIETIASGWGYTDDYHDWAVGLPQNERGEYFLGIPCQQDKRSSAAARFHGNVLRLAPRKPSADDPRVFSLEAVSAGHRFPMGLALDRDGELFVTDNQGNYNPFNELNHVRRGVHFGFINALEKGKPAPALTPPAIDIPHPWTRSVNGICFLYTPRNRGSRIEDRGSNGRDPRSSILDPRSSIFGPLEGHLIGCEYDTRRLIRMSLQRVGDTYQGAAYPLSIVPQDPQRGFLGPVVCTVSPKGELYVGSIRDSGWGAGNNVGEIVRVRVEPDKLPCGIAEVRAVSRGFVIDFFKPVDRELAGRADSYTIQSYRRESTPAYGGPDRDRRTEKVAEVTVAPDARRVTLRLAEMRAGFVYEFRLKNLAPGGGEFHPDEAHYTLRAVPK
jgi:cytochrome c553